MLGISKYADIERSGSYSFQSLNGGNSETVHLKEGNHGSETSGRHYPLDVDGHSLVDNQFIQYIQASREPRSS